MPAQRGRDAQTLPARRREWHIASSKRGFYFTHLAPWSCRGRTGRSEYVLKPTDIRDPDYFHKVVDCQWACPAHTPVPEYIRLIAAGRYADAYMVNWKSNVFPGILGRTCDRPCEPACRRGRVEQEPVAICRLKRVAADYKGDITGRLPRPADSRNGFRVACVGGGPAFGSWSRTSSLLSAATRLRRQIATGSASTRPRRQAGSHGRSQVRPRIPGKTLEYQLTMYASV
jgi:hypothetical protein